MIFDRFGYAVKVAHFLCCRIDPKNTALLLKTICLGAVTPFFELFSVGLLVPIIASILGNSDGIFMPLVSVTNVIAESTIIKDPILIMLILLFLCVVAATVIRVYWVHSVCKCAYAIGAELNSLLIDSILNSKYKRFLEIGIAESTSLVTVKTNNFLNYLLQPLLVISAASIQGVFVLIYLIWIDWIILLYFFIISIIFVVPFKSQNNKIKSMGAIINKKMSELNTFLANAFGNFKDIRLYNCAPNVVSEFREKDSDMRASAAGVAFLGALPRILVEGGFTLGGIVVITYFLYFSKLSSDFLAYLAGFIFATSRLLPTFVSGLSGWMTLKAGYKAADEIFYILEADCEAANSYVHGETNFDRNVSLIEIQQLSFKHRGGGKLIVKDFSCQIKAGDRVLVRGASGSGKSSFLDLICGLFDGDKGDIKIWLDDGESISRTNCGMIAYVTQDSYLLADSVKMNITFASSDGSVDECRIATITDLLGLDPILEWLDKGIDTVIGDGGYPLSGGQKQRIAIGRALYSGRPILILDEALSALDSNSARLVLQRISDIVKENNMILFCVQHGEVDESNFDLFYRFIGDGEVLVEYSSSPRT